MRLLVSTGERCQMFLHETMNGLQVNNLHVDEIWTYCGKHQKHVTEDEDGRYIGDQYVFVAMDSDSKLIPAFKLAKRSGSAASGFMYELSTRIVTRFQLSTDAFPAYVSAVDRAFGTEIDYGQVVKDYVSPPEREASRRYTPGRIIRTTKTVISGNPNPDLISTSHIERQNLTMRMSMRRFTRLTNAYSKKWENLHAALCLYFWHYNFARVHESLRVTPAMEHGLVKRILTWNDLFNWEISKRAA